MTTHHTSGAADLPEALRPIQRFEVVDCIDSKHVPAVIPKPHGPWVRYEDHVAALAAGQAVAPVEPLQSFESPRAQTLMRAWEEGWEACRDAEFVGEEAQNDAFNQSSTVNQCVVEDMIHSARPAPPAMDGGEDAARMDWIAVHGSFGVDSATGEVGGNGQKRLAATRKNIDAARAAQK